MRAAIVILVLLPLVARVQSSAGATTGETEPGIGSLEDVSGLVERGELARADSLARAVLQARSRHPDASATSVAEAWSVLGTVAYEDRRLGFSEFCQRRALEILDTGNGDPAETRRVVHDLALVLSYQGAHREALALFRRWLSEMEQVGSNHPLPRAVGRLNMAIPLTELGHHAEAERCIRDALTVFEEHLGDGHRLTGVARMNLGDLLLRTDRFEEARLTLLSARRTLTEASGPLNASVARVELNLAETALREGRSNEARTHFAATSRILGDREADLARCWALSRQGELELRAGRLESARTHLLEAAKVFENSWSVASPVELRKATTTAGRSPYPLLALLGVRTQDPRAALAAVERNCGRSVRALVERRWPERSHAEVADVERIAASLPTGAVLLGWIDAANERWAWLLDSRSEVEWLECPRIDDEIPRRFRRALQRPSGGDEIRRSAAALGDAVFGPLGSRLQGVDHLIVVPSGKILGLPLDALRLGDGTLVADSLEITYVPSGTVFARLRSLPPTRTEKALLAVGAPRGSMGAAAGTVDGVRSTRVRTAEILPRELPAARTELNRLAAMFPASTLLLDQDASEVELERLRSGGRLKQFRVLHFATHARLDDDVPRCALVLAPPEPGSAAALVHEGRAVLDGLLRPADILSGWQLDAELVTLSACGSALGEAIPGEGYVGFAHAFLAAGARSLVLSLWNVPDRPTRLLMERFYGNLLERGWSRAASLREAKAWLRGLEVGLRRPYAHPFFWAAFILVGDPGE